MNIENLIFFSGLFIVLSIILFYILIREVKIQLKKGKEIPQELIDDLFYLERKMKGGINEDGSKPNPYTALWELYKRKRDEERYRGITGEDKKIRGNKQSIDGRELYEQLVGRQNFQIPNTSITGKHKSEFKRDSRKIREGIKKIWRWIKGDNNKKVKMGEVIATTDIPREKGYVYYTTTDEKGNIRIERTKAGRKKKETNE